jgi:putative membrane protein
MLLLLAEVDALVTPHWHPASLLESIWSAAAFGALGIIMMMLGFKLFDWITPKLDIEKELSEKNMGVAIALAALFIGLGLIVAHAISG